jgi:hypothetical protein
MVSTLLNKKALRENFGSKNSRSPTGAKAKFRVKLFLVTYSTFSTPVTLHTHSPMKMEQTGCSEMLAFKLQSPVNNPEETYDI